MKLPTKIKTYCPKCKKHTEQKVKEYRKARTRAMSKGQRSHEIKIKGHGSKVAGEKHVYKQAKRAKLILTCSECGKKTERVQGSRTKKKPEIKG